MARILYIKQYKLKYKNMTYNLFLYIKKIKFFYNNFSIVEFFEYTEREKSYRTKTN